ncbi:MAG: DUF6152 family protein [Pseudomonadales bacterium]|nr:DUF6152 family protein [Pseudomonadales bacterium]
MNKLLILLGLAAIGTGSASAHHGLELFDTSQLIEIEGRVTGFRLMDPHSILFVEMRNSDGTVTTWEIEGGSGSGIVQSGLTQEFLNSEPLVRVEVYQSRDGECAPNCKASGRDFDFDRS